MDVSEETAAEAVEQAQSSGASQGVLRELRLRFWWSAARRELRIAFADLAGRLPPCAICPCCPAGVALAMVRDVVERVVPNPTPEDIRSIKREATDKAVESGASPDTVEVHIEIDPQTSKLTAIAMALPKSRQRT